MSLFKRITLSVLSITILMAPSAAAAFGGQMGYDPRDTGGRFETPYSARGKFVFVTRVSRRTLRKMIAQSQLRALQPPKMLLVTELL